MMIWDYLLDVIYGAWIAWTSPEFDWLRWMIIGGIIGATLGYVARLDAEEAARQDAEDAAWIAWLFSGKEDANG